MHTHDKTYLQALGFSDSDRKDNLHNACCLYLIQRDKVEKLLAQNNIVSKKDGTWSDWAEAKLSDRNSFNFYVWKKEENKKTQVFAKKKFRLKKETIVLPPQYEINKIIKSYAYKSFRIVGYVDVAISVKVHEQKNIESICLNEDELLHGEVGTQLEYKTVEEYLKNETGSSKYVYNSWESNIYIEVKKNFTDVTSVIQQINTYRAFEPESIYYLCTIYKVDELYKKTLLAHGIKHIYVDELSVKKFMGSQRDCIMEDF